MPRAASVISRAYFGFPFCRTRLALMPERTANSPLNFNLRCQTPAFAAQHFVRLHRSPLVENQRLQAGRQKHRLVAAVPAVFRQRAVDMDNFFALRAVRRPKNRVAENRQIFAEPARRGLAGGFQQRRAKCLVAQFGLAPQKNVPGPAIQFSRRLCRKSSSAGRASSMRSSSDHAIPRPAQSASARVITS